MTDLPAIEHYNERLAIGMFDGKLSEFEATRQAYFETKRIYGAVPEVVRLEWKRVYEEEMKRDKQG